MNRLILTNSSIKVIILLVIIIIFAQISIYSKKQSKKA